MRHASDAAPFPGRDLPFSYRCGRCGRCCSSMRIQVNPFEAARLARRLGLSTTTFLARHTESGVCLKPLPGGACPFLAATGCTVHPDRPLVCRLYPLSRHVSSDGRERFACLLPRPGSGGEFGLDGTIGEALEADGALVFMDQADAYLGLFLRVWKTFQWALAADPHLAALAADLRRRLQAGDAPQPSRRLDLDRCVWDYCTARGLVPPGDPAEKARLHREALDQWLAGMSREALAEGRGLDHQELARRAESLARLVTALGLCLGVDMAALLPESGDEAPPGARERDAALRLEADEESAPEPS